MSAITPDITGFIAAQDQLREDLGAPVTFRIPQDPVWPAGTKINPDTGEPYSAMVQRTNAEFAEMEVKALIIAKQGSPMRPQADTHFEQAGLLGGMDIILDVAITGYEQVSAASQFQVNGEDFALEEWKPFSLGGVLYRYLAYGLEM